MVTAIINDTHEILPLAIRLDGEYGVKGIAISVPCMVGSGGVVTVKQMKQTEDEKAAFDRSVAVIRENAAGVGIK